MSSSPSEGDGNRSPRRAGWLAGLDAESRSWLARDAQVYLHQSLSSPCLDVLERAEGPWLITKSGRRVLDFHGNAVHHVGHGHPRVVDAIKRQLEQLPFCPRRYTNQPAVELAERLTAIAPMLPAKTLLAPNGSAAIGMALKLARYATGRHKTVSMWDAFHGANLDAASVGGEALFRKDIGPLLPGTEHVPPVGLALRFFGEDGRAHDRLADYIDYVLEVQGDVGAVIAEPMRWTTVEPPPAGFWSKVRASCDRHGALLIFDEIPAGLARSGAWFTCQRLGCVPDMVVIGKGLGGGIMPLAALIARADLDIAGEVALGHYTHEKSPVAAAAALAFMDVIEAEGLIARAMDLGERGVAHWRALAESHEEILEIRHLGAYWGLAIGEGAAGADLADAILYACLDRGLSFKVGGGNVLTLCPPLTLKNEELALAASILGEAMAKAKDRP